jgi:hypothetical protein
MAITAGALGSESSSSGRLIFITLGLLGIFVLSGVFLALNYWFAVVFFFLSLLLLICFSLNEYEARGLLLLLVFSLFVTVLVSSLALLFLSNDSRVSQLAQSNTLANFFLGSNLRIILTSLFTGLIAPLPLIVVPLLVVTAVATFGILQWHRKDQTISGLKAFWYVLAGLLGILHFSVVVENDEIKGSAKDKERLKNFGGPGWLTVYSGQVVVLHHWGKISRIVGQGSTMLKREEQIKAICFC